MAENLLKIQFARSVSFDRPGLVIEKLAMLAYFCNIGYSAGNTSLLMCLKKAFQLKPASNLVIALALFVALPSGVTSSLHHKTFHQSKVVHAAASKAGRPTRLQKADQIIWGENSSHGH